MTWKKSLRKAKFGTESLLRRDKPGPGLRIPDVLATLGVSRTQLTALAVVSRNDYHKNIYPLGPTTNFSIIKSIGSSPDARKIVTAYLKSW
ncbi:hypothetical protein BGX30_012867 [Mortierella sp. GBA39]|nr:hypothetical protein BGX30_012867 [Mortierella sp. GBA39]